MATGSRIYLATGSLKSGLSTGKYNLLFKPVDGFQAPKMQVVEVTGGQFTISRCHKEDKVEQLTGNLAPR